LVYSESLDFIVKVIYTTASSNITSPWSR
jgi:hypothetical protein